MTAPPRGVVWTVPGAAADPETDARKSIEGSSLPLHLWFLTANWRDL